jgi:predicted O-methyltransferase YrrM
MADMFQSIIARDRLHNLKGGNTMSEATSLAFCPVLDDLCRERKARDSDGTEHAVGGLSTINNLFMLRALMLEFKPQRTIETGLASGGSALLFASTHKDLGHAPSHQHVAIDPHQQTVWHNLGKTLLTRAGLDQFTTVIEEPSYLALPALLRKGERFQMAYIDGAHAIQEVFLDFYYIRHLLDLGGIVLFDDCSRRGVGQVISIIRNELVSFKELDLAPFRSERNPWRYRIGRMLNRVQCLGFQKVADADEDERQWKL